MLLASGCLSQEARDRAAVTEQIRAQVVPALETDEDVAGLKDLRDLERPNGKIQALLEGLSSVPRVIEADQDRALLAIWRTAAPTAEPFNANRTATGRACVEITRSASGMAVRILNCPNTLREVPPSSKNGNWSGDAEAVAGASHAASSLGEEVRWTLFRNDDATAPRTTPRSAKGIAKTLEARARALDNPDSRITVTRTPLIERNGTVTGKFRITAQVPDPTDEAGTVTASCRYALEADLSITSSTGHENWKPVRHLSC